MEEIRAPKGGATWECDMDAYVAKIAAMSGPLAAKRVALAEVVRGNATSAAGWSAFLSLEDDVADESMQSSLYRLYEWATKTIPRSPNAKREEYLQVWLGYVRHQMRVSADDARDTFKCLKGARIGEDFARLYIEWANFERKEGNVDKALGILQKGLQKGAKPEEDIRNMCETLAGVGGPAVMQSPALARRAPLGSSTPNAAPTNGSATPTVTIRSRKALSTPKMGGEEPATVILKNRVRPAACLTPGGPSMHDGDGTPTMHARNAATLEAETLVLKQNQHRISHVYSSSTNASQTGSQMYSQGRAHRVGLSIGPTPGTVGSACGSSGGSNAGTATKQIGNTDGMGDETVIIAAEQQSKGESSARKSASRRLKPAMSSGLSKLGGPARRIASAIPETPSLLEEMDIHTIHLSRITEGSSDEKPSSSGSRSSDEEKEISSAKTVGAGNSLGGGGKEDEQKEHSLVTKEEAPNQKLMTPRLANRSQNPKTPGTRDHAVRTININIAGKLMRDKSKSSATPLKTDGGNAADEETVPLKKQRDESAPSSVPHPQTQAPAVRQGQAVAEAKVKEPPAAQPGHDIAPKSRLPSNKSSDGQRQRRVREDENTVVVRSTRYVKLECVGKGGSSKVFKVMAPNKKILALKRIRITGREAGSASGFLEEITLLQRLRGRDNIIQLVDSEYIKGEGLIYMVLECGEIDLARMLAKKAKLKSGIDENFIRLYWQQMLEAVAAIHEERIVHSDLKPANFLFVEGTLKLIDFGIAKTIQNDTTNIVRDSQVGTLNYMSPEAIQGTEGKHKLGRASDVWSLGCILYQMIYGVTPFASLPFIQKLHAITDAKHAIKFPPCPNPHIEDIMRRCLDRNPRTRITMPDLLNHPFLHPEAVAQSPAVSTKSTDGVTMEQLRAILAQISGNAENAEHLTMEAMRQIRAGGEVDLSQALHDTTSNVKKMEFSSSNDSLTNDTQVDSVHKPLPAQTSPPPKAQAQAQAQAVVHQNSQESKENIVPRNLKASAVVMGSSVPFDFAAQVASRAKSLGTQPLKPVAASHAHPTTSVNKKPFMTSLQAEILKKQAALKHVSPVPRPPHSAASKSEGIAGMLERGLARFQVPIDADVMGEGNTTHDWDF